MLGVGCADWRAFRSVAWEDPFADPPTPLVAEPGVPVHIIAPSASYGPTTDIRFIPE